MWIGKGSARLWVCKAPQARTCKRAPRRLLFCCAGAFQTSTPNQAYVCSFVLSALSLTAKAPRSQWHSIQVHVYTCEYISVYVYIYIPQKPKELPISFCIIYHTIRHVGPLNCLLFRPPAATVVIPSIAVAVLQKALLDLPMQFIRALVLILWLGYLLWSPRKESRCQVQSYSRVFSAVKTWKSFEIYSCRPNRTHGSCCMNRNAAM